MQCALEEIPDTLDARGYRTVRCMRAGCTKAVRTHHPLHKITSRCMASTDEQLRIVLDKPLPVLHGPGTELRKLLKQLGAKPLKGCGCAAKAAEWNRNGLEWCKAHREEMAAYLREKYSKLAWTDVAAFATRAVASGLALQILSEGPAEALVNLAIERAEKTAANT